MKKTFLAFTVLTLSSLSLAGSPAPTSANAQKEAQAGIAQRNAAQADLLSPFSTSTCSFSFVSGTGGNFLRYCVTANGNITQFETPQGHEHIAVGVFAEGYGFCDFTSSIRYTDYADFGDSGNWNPATVLSHNATTVRISRTTTDGLWTLNQTFTQNAGDKSVKVSMALKNNSAVDRFVFFVRYADADVDGSFLNNFDATDNSSFAWNPTGRAPGNGMLMLDLGLVPPGSHGGFTQITPVGPDPCNPIAQWIPGTQIGVDGSVAHLYGVHIAANTSQTFALSYKGM